MKLAEWVRPAVAAAAAALVAWGTLRSDVAHVREAVAVIAATKAEAGVVDANQRAVLRELDEIHQLLRDMNNNRRGTR